MSDARRATKEGLLRSYGSGDGSASTILDAYADLAELFSVAKPCTYPVLEKLIGRTVNTKQINALEEVLQVAYPMFTSPTHQHFPTSVFLRMALQGMNVACFGESAILMGV